MITQPWYRWEGTDLLLSIHIQPRARQDKIMGPHGDALKIRLTAAPIEGQANSYLLRFLASIFSVPLARVILVSGSTRRGKRIRIVSPPEIPKELREWLVSIP